METYPEFSREEYDRRCRELWNLMEKRGFDALLVSSEQNCYYFTGYRTDLWKSYTRPIFTIIPNGREPTLIVFYTAERAVRKISWVKDVLTWRELPFSSVVVRESLEKLGLENARIGAELGLEQRLGLPYNDFMFLQESLPKAEFLDASEIIWELRRIKSEEEIDRVREACRITSVAYEKTFEEVREGMSERQIARTFFTKMMEEGADKPGFIMIASGVDNYYSAAAGPTDRILKRGDLLWIDGGAVYRGYWSDFSRMAIIGNPSQKQRSLHKQVVDITKKCIEAVKPGVKVSEIARIAGVELVKAGLPEKFAGRIGHGIGLSMTEPPSISINDNTLLQAGMTITIEPGFVTDEGWFVVEENLAVTREGSKLLSEVSPEIFLI